MANDCSDSNAFARIAMEVKGFAAAGSSVTADVSFVGAVTSCPLPLSGGRFIPFRRGSSTEEGSELAKT